MSVLDVLIAVGILIPLVSQWSLERQMVDDIICQKIEDCPDAIQYNEIQLGDEERAKTSTTQQLLSLSSENEQQKVDGSPQSKNDTELDFRESAKNMTVEQFSVSSPNQRTSVANDTTEWGLQYQTKIPLEPPFQIIQYGSMRSASTFQHQLLTSLAHWKSPPGTEFANHGIFSLADIPADLGQNLSFVMKSHNVSKLKRWIKNPSEANGKIAIFTSGDAKQPGSLHHQSRESVVNCSLCQIDNYQPIFGLTDEEVTVMKNHFSLWGKLRQCCGLQSSKYHRMKLHGCDTTPYESLPDYPWCERENITAIELEFAESPIPFFPNDPQFNWAKPGDCDRFDRMMRNGRDFNRQRFYSCEDFKQKWLKE